uniref:RNA binding motif protein 20 n=1 Tax=Astyanax mexicanus TaxID=7994 RepID=A0A8B9HTQ5_ASTMX
FDKLDKKAVPVGGVLGGGGQNLLLSPASLQLAQLQAQLTLHRLKLAQTSNTAAAATVLNQVLSNVAMSQPLFNQLRGSNIGQAHGRGFSPAPISFPPPAPTLGTLVHHAGIRLNHYGGVGNTNQNSSQHGEFGKKVNAFQTDTDRRIQFGFLGGTVVGPSKSGNAGQYGAGSAGVPTKNNTQNHYQRDFYPSEGQQGVFVGGDQSQDSNQKEPWKNTGSFPISGKQLDMNTGAGSGTWGPAPQGFSGPRAELYNPEEPTGEPRGQQQQQQGFAGYQQQQQKGEEGMGLTLQAHQLNDYHGVTPSHLPHQCTICEKKVYNLKDWDQHVKGKLHLQNPTPGRVVHICNLPEGSCTENDVINLGLPFGKVTNYILMRSTHQAFLEMAYVEAAQAMVQYYQLQPAKINDQKLLIRMSKRYKELQLKKPGKDVESIIQDINSQREREEMQEMDRYLPERARSRSPISRSLSPRSHSPSFTSCSSSHSPQGAPCRPEWINGLGPRRGSWDWSSHGRRDEDPRDRDEWRNGEDERTNGRIPERRKPYLKTGERGSPRQDRDWYPRGSPQPPSFCSYHPADDFYKKESLYKSDKTLWTSHNQRHEGKSKRRDSGDHHRTKNSESELPEDRTPEERGRSKRTSRRQEREDKETNENHKEATEDQQGLADSFVSCVAQVEEWASGDETEGECWYPKSMEELVTVDEVGEEDDSIVEPDLPELQEEEEPVEKPPQPTSILNTNHSAVSSTAPGDTDLQKPPPPPDSGPENSSSLSHSESRDPSHCYKVEIVMPSLYCVKWLKIHIYIFFFIPDGQNSSHSPPRTDIEAPSPSREQEKIISEYSIPLGVEFIVPRTGFFCKLCGLFYTSEDTAKTTHCRSTVHYRNLQVNLHKHTATGF